MDLEEVMSTITLTAVHWRRGPRWQGVVRGFSQWRQLSRSRRELMGLSDTILRDIGISRCDAVSEASKPFWQV
jgi:uncharacterized protein YjiS (DUF1127 family)